MLQRQSPPLLDKGTVRAAGSLTDSSRNGVPRLERSYASCEPRAGLPTRNKSKGSKSSYYLSCVVRPGFLPSERIPYVIAPIPSSNRLLASIHDQVVRPEPRVPIGQRAPLFRKLAPASASAISTYQHLKGLPLRP